jgi:hypothetical protein
MRFYPIFLSFLLLFHALAAKEVVHRNYWTEVTLEEKNDIGFIILTLSYKNLPKLLLNKSQLENAGKRVDHVHPLKFLDCIFQDEELKVGIRNIKKRGGLVWSSFIEGLARSLEEEKQRGTMEETEFQDFSERLLLNPDIIACQFFGGKWEELIFLLIEHIPRNSGADRYDI